MLHHRKCAPGGVLGRWLGLREQSTQTLPKPASFVSFLPEQERYPPEAATQQPCKNSQHYTGRLPRVLAHPRNDVGDGDAPLGMTEGVIPTKRQRVEGSHGITGSGNKREIPRLRFAPLGMTRRRRRTLGMTGFLIVHCQLSIVNFFSAFRGSTTMSG